MQPRNEEVIRIYKPKSRKVAQVPQIVQVASDSPKERLSIGRWIGNKLKETAKHYGKQILLTGATMGSIVAAHYAGKRANDTYKEFAERVLEPVVVKGVQAAYKNPKAALARGVQVLRHGLGANLLAVAGIAADAWLSDFELYKKYLQPYIRAFATWAYDNWNVIKIFLKLWAAGGAAVKSIGAILLLIHTVAYYYEEDYRNWFVGLGIAGSIIYVIQKACETVPVAVRKLIEWVKKGYSFVKDCISRVVDYVKKNGKSMLIGTITSVVCPPVGIAYLLTKWQESRKGEENGK